MSLFNSKILKTIPDYKILIRRDLMFRHRHTVLYTVSTLFYFILFIYILNMLFVLFCFFFLFCFLLVIAFSFSFFAFPRLD